MPTIASTTSYGAVVDCVYEFSHGDKKPDGDGDVNIFIPTDRYRDGHGKTVAGTGMKDQYPLG